MSRVIRFIDSFVEKLSNSILVASLFVMLFLSVMGIVCRWFDLSFLWLEPLVRHLVFLSIFMGAVLASGRGIHIGIDILGKYFEQTKNHRGMRLVTLLTSLATILTLCWLLKSSIAFMNVERLYDKEVFWGIRSSSLVGIIPFGFMMIMIRSVTKLVTILTFKEESR